jgi:hypothetical protein
VASVGKSVDTRRVGQQGAGGLDELVVGSQGEAGGRDPRRWLARIGFAQDGDAVGEEVAYTQHLEMAGLVEMDVDREARATDERVERRTIDAEGSFHPQAGGDEPVENPTATVVHGAIEQDIYVGLAAQDAAVGGRGEEGDMADRVAKPLR